jgi:predicted transcriptional regulator
MFLRIAVPDAARHIGGLTLFGRDFGNYNQDIEFRILYSV